MSKALFYPYKSDRKFGRILNIGITSTSKEKVLAFVRDSLSHRKKFFVVTPNAEIVLASNSDPELAKSLNESDIAIPDGVALLSAIKLGVVNLPKNRILRFVKTFFFWILYFYVYTFDSQRLESGVRLIKGREMFLELTKLANKKHWKIFLLGGRKGEAEATANILSHSLKGVKIAYSSGPELNQAGGPASLDDREIEKSVVTHINNFAPQILFVGFGAPKQEKWTAKWYRKLNIGGAMVVGGTFNYIAGYASLPPRWMEKSGLEWLWRLVTQPWRAGRIFNAVVIFPLKVLSYKLKNE